MPGTTDVEDFARLIEALHPWLDQVVVIGGWAQRLYRLHPLAQPLSYEPLATPDTDIAVPPELPVGEKPYGNRRRRQQLEWDFSLFGISVVTGKDPKVIANKEERA